MLLRIGAVCLATLLSETCLAQDEANVEACHASGLIALRERSPAVIDLAFDRTTLTVAKADTRIEGTPIKTIIMGDAYLEKARTGRPYRFVCIIGEKGKVLLTFFTKS